MGGNLVSRCRGLREEKVSANLYLFENNLLALASSCDGDPAPDRVLPAILPAEFKLPEIPNGDLNALPLEGSVGEVLAVEDPERGRLVAGCGR